MEERAHGAIVQRRDSGATHQRPNLRDMSRRILSGLILLAAASLAFLAGLLSGADRNARGEPLRLVRDAEDAHCLATLEEHLRAWRAQPASQR